MLGGALVSRLGQYLEFQDKVVNVVNFNSTNSRASDIAAAAKVFKDALDANNGKPVKVATGVEFYIAAASILEQEMAEASGDWQVLLAAGARPLPSGCGKHVFLLFESWNKSYMG